MPRILGATRSTSPHEIGEPQILGELERGNAAGLEHYRRAGEMLPEAKSKLEMPRGVGGLRVIFISVDGVRSAICSSLKNPEKEAQIARALGLQLIDIGYKVLVTKLHPDKGGSSEAMTRLNRPLCRSSRRAIPVDVNLRRER